MGGGASLMAPMRFFPLLKRVGFHMDCDFSYMLFRLPGILGEYLGLTGARLNGKELVAAGLATYFLPLVSWLLPEMIS
ncbi:hypothetical protein HAX54_038273 [Datura stramonium]|uniref:3-hydroxyisobutyryl-CoA hydrolase n=1 Tax=Datura stramonium TaxID=4076 RepID=A0ABS8VJI1_DATST|nr:hypothetical protein [Datura stramonium]